MSIVHVLAPGVVPLSRGSVQLYAILASLVPIAVVGFPGRPVGVGGLVPVAVPHPPALVHVILEPQPHVQHSCGVHGSSSSSSSSSRSSNWILMSCQPHRVTSGQSNSGHKQIHISKLFSHIDIYIYINPLSSQSTKPNTSQT